MQKITKYLAVLCTGIFAIVGASAQAPKITAREAVNRNLEASSLTYNGSPFHAVLVINQPTNPNSQFQGTVEIYWASPTRYRVTVTSHPFSQTRIVSGNAVEETHSGNFYPSWLRNYFLAVFELLPRAEEFHGDSSPLVFDPKTSLSCSTHNTVADVMTWIQTCFTGSEPRVKYTMNFTYFMEYGDYQPFGTKMIPRTFTDYDKNNDKVLGKLTILEPLKPADKALLEVEHPTPASEQIETHFVPASVSASLLEQPPAIEWPAISEGKTEGTITLHILTDRSGQVHEAYMHSSDTPSLGEFADEQAKKLKFKPLLLNGAPVQMETSLVLHFSTKLASK